MELFLTQQAAPIASQPSTCFAGLVIVVMAIDRVKGLLPGWTDVAVNPNISVLIFATGWITHFLAHQYVSYLPAPVLFLCGGAPGRIRERRHGSVPWRCAVRLRFQRAIVTIHHLGSGLRRPGPG